jgi:TfoX/Sxy family transcriptional regulator of competence genes
MAFDEGLAERLRDLLRQHDDVSEKKMFGGLAFMLDGHIFVGILGDRLMARVGPADYVQALSRPHASEMDFTGKPMKGYVYIEPEGFESDQDLESWVAICTKFVSSLPPK